MRKSMIEKLSGLIESMHDLHQVLLKEENISNIITYLSECQKAAIVIGENIEKYAPKTTMIVEQLEQYCEEAFSISCEDQIRAEHINVLDKYVKQTETLLSLIPVTYHIVFFPYKVEMWDSLESIWLECKKDERCECFVVPLPYYEHNNTSECWESRYDGKLFPKTVPVVDYDDYSVETYHPDIAYIHNPFDDINYVTSIHPSYYSYELKKYVKKLVYVPYFITSGMFDRSFCPVYKHMDYMIVQAPFVKDYLRGFNLDSKLLALGSPKLDSVIQACKHGGIMPEAWKPVVHHKKVLMLNTSIGCLLSDGSYLLHKLRYLFEILANQDEVVLIWRPHPLLDAAIKSMRMNLLAEYEALISYFHKCRIGVLDQTSNIENTIALSDGYIGEESSSVINLFEAVGKPVFILNNNICRRYSAEEKRRVQLWDIVKSESEVWAVTNTYNALLRLDENVTQFRFAGRIENHAKWCGASASAAVQGKSLFFSPYLAKFPVSFHMENCKFQRLLPEQDKEMLYGKIIAYKDKLFYLPYSKSPILEFNVKTNIWKSHADPIDALVGNKALANMSVTFEYGISGAYLWIPAAYANRVLQFNMNTGSYTCHQIGRAEHGYSGIVVDGSDIWLAEVHSGEVIRWNRHTKKLSIYKMPEEFRYRKTPYGMECAQMALVDMGRWVVTIPWLSNRTVKIEKDTGRTVVIASEFWKDVEAPANNYRPDIHPSVSCYYKQDETTLMVQRMTDCAAALINVEEDTYEQYYPTLTQEDYEKLTAGEDGFEQISEEHAFFRRESPIFSLEDFLEDLVNERLDGVRERQMESLKHIAVNLDGTCGKKVHKFMMEVLSQGSNTKEKEINL